MAWLRASRLLLALSLGLSACIVYPVTHIGPVFLALWALSFAAAGWHFHSERTTGQGVPALDRRDGAAAALLLLAFAPAYLALTYRFPHQVNSDELAIFGAVRDLWRTQAPELISDYFRFPSLIFFAMGALCKLLGGITWANLRLAHGAVGLASVGLAYAFFRCFFGRIKAAAAATVLGACHSLVIISRMAMRQNSTLFVELAAFNLLYRGLVAENVFLSFLGGAAAGAAFHVYEPARIAPAWWALFLAWLAWGADKAQRRRLVRHAGPALAGFALAVAPLAVSFFEWRGHNPDAFRYQREQFMFFAEARAKQLEWSYAKSAAEAMRWNILEGLTTFNSKTTDQAWMYVNRRHGFLDPFTGLLIWIGLARVCLKRKIGPGDKLLAGGFLFHLLFFSLVTAQCPNYTRLLLTLPYVAYLAVEALGNSPALLAAGVLLVAGLNVRIGFDFARAAWAKGDPLGGTIRYVDARKDVPNYVFDLVSSEKSYPYFPWGEIHWRGWLMNFVGESQDVEVLDPKGFLRDLGQPPLTIFMTRALWLRSEPELRRRYKGLQLSEVTPDGRLLAAEILP